MANQIRWKKGDYIRLGKAVADFNKKVKRLETEESKVYLPEIVEYKEAKENITTRQEFNRLINSLKRFQKEGAEDIYTTEAGERITKWEHKEIKKEQKRSIRNLQWELLGETVVNKSTLGMGNVRIKEIKATIKNIQNFEEKTGFEFISGINRIKKLGRLDYNNKRSLVYQENYIKTMEKYSSFDNYDKLVQKFENLKDPQKFYEFFSQDELAVDLTYQSTETFKEEDFNKFLNSLGIETDNEEIDKNEITYGLFVNGNLIKSSNSIEELKFLIINRKIKGAKLTDKFEIKEI